MTEPVRNRGHYKPRMEYDPAIELQEFTQAVERLGDMDVVRDSSSLKFHLLMIQQMVVGWHKYGSWIHKAGEFRVLESLRLRLKKYEETGNAAFLADSANFAMMEFMAPRSPKLLVPPFLDGGADSPGQVSAEGRIVNRGLATSATARFR